MDDDDYRAEQTLIGTEREQLEAFLADNRRELVGIVAGLSEEQARRRLVPSLTSPLAILKHCVFVEKAWWQVTLAGRTRTELAMPEEAEDSWVLAPGDTVASLLAEYAAAVTAGDELAAGMGLDDLAPYNRRGPLTLRWVYVHLVEELARHAGHGDILRELILAGDPL